MPKLTIPPAADISDSTVANPVANTGETSHAKKFLTETPANQLKSGAKLTNFKSGGPDTSQAGPIQNAKSAVNEATSPVDELRFEDPSIEDKIVFSFDGVDFDQLLNDSDKRVLQDLVQFEIDPGALKA